MARIVYSKKKPSRTGESCPRCGKPLVNRINSKTNRSFIGCSGYPKCEYIYSPVKYKIDYAGESFSDNWRPKFSNELIPLIEKCESKPEMQFLFGAAYFLDYECGLSKTPLGMELYKTDIEYQGKIYPAIRFDEPYVYWGGGTMPSAMAFVPQLEFAGKYHHDFGISPCPFISLRY
jgi:ssDNA-binding Zn-finger/Zn-ribbon topoisomerase 1